MGMLRADLRDVNTWREISLSVRSTLNSQINSYASGRGLRSGGQAGDTLA